MRNIFVILVLHCLSAPCFGDIVYSNGDQFANDGTHYGKSDNVWPSVILADNFRLNTNATIDSVRWWGAWNFYTPATDNFVINFYANNAGLPDPSNLIASRNVGNVNEVSTGLYRSYFTLLEFQADIAPVTLMANTDYWVSIYESSGSNSSQYFLWRIIQNGGSATSNDEGVSWGGFSAEYAFQLEGAAVPEPSSAALLLTTAAAIPLARRRRK